MVTTTDREKHRRAIDAITANCGAHARTLLASNREMFTDEKTRALAGTAPEYQKHVIGRAASGDGNPFRMIAATLLVYDTVPFREVTNHPSEEQLESLLPDVWAKRQPSGPIAA